MQHFVKALLVFMAIVVTVPAFAGRYDEGRDRGEWSNDHEHRHDRDRYEQERYDREREQARYERERYEREREREREWEMEREREMERHRHSPCRVEGWYDRDGYYHERRVCPEPAVEINVPLPLPPGIPLPPGVHFR
jgi:hypothetical protein